MELGTGYECVNLKESGWEGYGREAAKWLLGDEYGDQGFQPNIMTTEETEQYIKEEFRDDWYPIPYPDPLDDPLYDPDDY